MDPTFHTDFLLGVSTGGTKTSRLPRSTGAAATKVKKVNIVKVMVKNAEFMATDIVSGEFSKWKCLRTKVV